MIPSLPSYIINNDAIINVPRGIQLPAKTILEAVLKSRDIMTKFTDFEVDVFSLLGMRNLSAFVGEVFAAALIKTTDDLFRKNPHQDGYPDLLIMDTVGKAHWESMRNRLRDKAPFSPFATGGIEVKATCGSVPTPKNCTRDGYIKPDIGDERISVLMGYNWKAHHRETNHLLGIVWDFHNRVPTIAAVFYSDQLEITDWGEIIKPKEGGGRTTSVSIMTRGGVRKMYGGWILMIDDPRYSSFFERHNALERPRKRSRKSS